MAAKIHCQAILSTSASVSERRRLSERYSIGNQRTSTLRLYPLSSHSSKKHLARLMIPLIGVNSFGISALSENPGSVKTRRWPDSCKKADSCNFFDLLSLYFRSALDLHRSFRSSFLFAYFSLYSGYPSVFRNTLLRKCITPIIALFSIASTSYGQILVVYSDRSHSLRSCFFAYLYQCVMEKRQITQRQNWN